MSASWLLTGASVIGPGHVVDGMPNQDALLYRRLGGGFLSVVCDGMGSRAYSHIGSRLACRAVHEIVAGSSYSIESREVVEGICARWLSLLDGLRPEDAVSTCLVCWGSPSGNIRYFQLGDGRIIARGMEHEEGDLFSNETIGLGVPHELSDWRTGSFQLDRGQGLLMMTDGISEDIAAGCENEMLAALVGSLKRKNSRRAKKSLIQELHDWPTPNHIDDKTITVVVRL